MENTEAFEVDILIPHDLQSRGVRVDSPHKAKVYIKDGMLPPINKKHHACVYPLDDKVIVTHPPTTRPPDYSKLTSVNCNNLHIAMTLNVLRT